MQTECKPKLFDFEAVERRSVVAGFDGGNITSNAGALLLGQVDRGLGLVRRFANCFIDRRDPRYVEHRAETLVGQRIFGLALGYEDLNDHDELRKDPTFAVLAGKLSPVLRTDCEALAGKSTLNRLEHTPRRHASKYHKIDCDGAQVDALLVDLFLDAHDSNKSPRRPLMTARAPMRYWLSTKRCEAGARNSPHDIEAARLQRLHALLRAECPTKPQLATRMIEHAMAKSVPFRWVAGDTVYGVGDINCELRQAGKGYVRGVDAFDPGQTTSNCRDRL